MTTSTCSPACRGLAAAILIVPGLLSLLPGRAHAEEAVIVASTAPGEMPGTIIADGATFVLPDGASATLLFRTGQMLRLRGPFEGPLTVPSESSSGAMAEALRLAGADVSVVGGSRNVAPSARRAMDGQDILVDPQRTATYCLGPADTLWLRRPASGDTLGLLRHQNLRTVSWPAGAPKIAWPDDVMIDDGDRIDIVDPAAHATLATVSFRRSGKTALSETAWIAHMMIDGCGEQARIALREVARGSVPPDLYLASERGRHPTYRRGEPLRLVLQANVDGELYCFARTPGDGTVAIFPAGASGGAHVEGHVPLSVPGDRIKVKLRASPSGGKEEVRCYLADRDIAAELPAPLLDRGFTPLPDDLADALDTTFAAVPMTRIAKASLTLEVE